MGIEEVHRETFAAGYEAGIAALRALGWRAHTAHRVAERWRKHEDRELAELQKLWGQGDDVYFARFEHMIFRAVKDDPLSSTLPVINQVR